MQKKIIWLLRHNAFFAYVVLGSVCDDIWPIWLEVEEKIEVN